MSDDKILQLCEKDAGTDQQKYRFCGEVYNSTNYKYWFKQCCGQKSFSQLDLDKNGVLDVNEQKQGIGHVVQYTKMRQKDLQKYKEKQEKECNYTQPRISRDTFDMRTGQ